MRSILLLFFLATCTANAVAQSVLKTMLRLPDTGQTMSYTSTFGEDNDFTINPPGFILNGNGTVTDTVTGLMWQQVDGGEMIYAQANYYCDTLTLGGYTDWRLPNAYESFSILNHQHTNPAVDNTVFTTTGAEYWWSSDRQANDTNRIWVTNSGGGIGNHLMTETISAGGTKKYHARAVRMITTAGTVPAHYTDNGDGSITDHVTGLAWQKIPYADTLTWEQALTYADSLTLAGKSDWRLPNIRELQSIADLTAISPSVNTNYFSVSGNKKFWSSTTLPNQTTKAWYLDTHYGITTYDLKTSKDYVLCVRGNQPFPNATTELNMPVANVFAYPNPFTRKISLHGASNAIVTLATITGRVVYHGTAIDQQDFSKLPPGIYFLSIHGKQAAPTRLVKQE